MGLRNKAKLMRELDGKETLRKKAEIFRKHFIEDSTPQDEEKIEASSSSSATETSDSSPLGH